MKQQIVAIWMLCLVLVSCQKREPAGPGPVPPGSSGGSPVGARTPEEPMLNLAWKAAAQLQAGMDELALPKTIHMETTDNGAGIPADAVSYFQAALETRLEVLGMKMPGDSPIVLEGSLYWLRNQLVYGFRLRRGGQTVLSDSASIPRDDRLDNTLAQFAPPGEPGPHARAQTAIPTPVTRLEEAPLDVSQRCPPRPAAACDILLLYSNRLEILNWLSGDVTVKNLPDRFLSPVRSRAPSGKILIHDNGVTVLGNNLAGPLTFDASLQGPASGTPLQSLPVATPGINTYALGDGRFTDFQMLPGSGIAVIEAGHRLGVAREGAFVTASEPAGDSIAVNWPHIYTSAAVLPSQQDSVRKYTFRDGSLSLESERRTAGQVLNLSLTDLNRDGAPELLVTIRKPEGIFIEVWEAF